MSPLTIILLFAGVAVVAYIVDARFFAPRRRMKLMAELQERAKTMDPRALENPEYGTLECEGDSLTIITKKERLKIEWADIDEVHAFKRDIFTVDLIFLDIRMRGLARLLFRRLPQITEWFGKGDTGRILHLSRQRVSGGD